MKKINSFIGKDLMEMLMFSMYPDAKIIYREYIQNAYDSINTAVKQNILPRVKDGIVAIKIDQSGHNIIIRDNGTGISKDYALKVLTSIADSSKDGYEQAGVYGIGRLVGAGYCRELVFKTSVVGEDEASIVTFDVEKTRSILDDKNDRRSATELVNSIVSYNSVSEDINEHYFEVTLHGVKEEYPILLSEDDIIEYIKEVAPIDYQMPFKNNIMFESLQDGSEFDTLQKNLKYIKISVNNHLDIRKRYSDSIIGTGDEILGLEYFMLEDEIFGKLAWGWFAITQLTKAIPASDPNRGIRLRKLNIQIGQANYLNQYFDEARGNNYFYGEIHVIHPNLRPNTSRDGLTPTQEAYILFKKLKNYFKELKGLYNLANKAKTAVRDINAAGAKIRQVGISETEKKEAQATLNSGKKKLETVEKNTVSTKNNAEKVILNHYKQQIASTTSIVEEPKQGKEPTKEPLLNPQNNPINVSGDLFEPLKGKYKKEDIFLMRKVFKLFSQKCPTSSLPVIEDIKKLVIKELSK